MKNQLVEFVAVKLYQGDWDMDDVRSINDGSGFTYDHSPHGNNWLRTQGAHMSETEMAAAQALAADWQANGLPLD